MVPKRIIEFQDLVLLNGIKEQRALKFAESNDIVKTGEGKGEERELRQMYLQSRWVHHVALNSYLQTRMNCCAEDYTDICPGPPPHSRTPSH